MNTLSTTRTSLRPTAPMADNPDPAATLLAVALQVPEGGLDHRVDLAAAALRLTGGQHTLVGSFHCVLHAGMPAKLIAERCHLPLDQVTDRTPVAVALTTLERYLTEPPYVLVTHNASVVSSVIARYAGACPVLNTAHLVDTAALARSALEPPYPVELYALTAHLGVSAAPTPAQTATDAALTWALYAHLLHIDRRRAVAEGAQPARPLPNDQAGHRQVCGTARPGREVHHG